MTQRLLMLDSGAFSVWTKGHAIDVDDYGRFCAQNPRCSNFVNLDVIPGKPGQKRTLTKEGIEAACVQGWKNYQRLLRRHKLPLEKVIPVYHMGDSLKWLEKYLEFGTPYLGISPANDMTTEQKARWMRTLRGHLFDSKGKPVVKTHGFAVTSYRLMQYWKWHSVDSASWVRRAAYGFIYTPQTTGGRYDYTKKPLDFALTSRSPFAAKKQAHLSNISPGVKKNLLAYLKSIGVSLGSVEFVDKPEGEKLAKNEVWHDKARRVAARTVEEGVVSELQHRYHANAEFVKRANDALSTVDHIYFAGGGAGIVDWVEFDLGRRLLSFAEVEKSKSSQRLLQRHLELMEA